MNRIFHICPLFILLCLYSNTKAQDFEVGGIAYNVLSASELTVEVAPKSCNFYRGNINIPATVTYNGTTYDVVALGEMAFYGGALSSVSIPSSVSQIKEQCFLFATGPSSITVPASVTEIGKLAFAAYQMTSISGCRQPKLRVGWRNSVQQGHFNPCRMPDGEKRNYYSATDHPSLGSQRFCILPEHLWRDASRRP